MTPIFVYGTLKRGFPLHDQALRDARFIGAVATVERYPLVIGGPWFGPMMFDEPGEGHRIHGELFEVDAGQLAAVDEAERIGEPGNLKTWLRITSLGGGTVLEALAYPKARFLAEPRHSGLIADYQDRRYIPPWQR